MLITVSMMMMRMMAVVVGRGGMSHIWPCVDDHAISCRNRGSTATKGIVFSRVAARAQGKAVFRNRGTCSAMSPRMRSSTKTIGIRTYHRTAELSRWTARGSYSTPCVRGRRRGGDSARGVWQPSRRGRQGRCRRRPLAGLRGPGRKYGTPVSGCNSWCPELESRITHRAWSAGAARPGARLARTQWSRSPRPARCAAPQPKA